MRCYLSNGIIAGRESETKREFDLEVFLVEFGD